MVNRSSPSSRGAGSDHGDSYAVLYGRSARIGLLCLFLITVLFAVGALIIKYKLETFRVQVQDEARRRTGSDMQVGTVIVNGLRGLRVDDLDIRLAGRTGPSCRIQSPSAYIYIDLVDLLHGEITIDRVQIDGSTISVEGVESDTLTPQGGVVRWADNELLTIPAFRATGRDCTLNVIQNDATAITLHNLTFDVARMADSPDLNAHAQGAWGTAKDKTIDVRLRYASPSDFDARAELTNLTAADFAPLMADSTHFVETGTLSPSLRVAGYPNDTWVVSCTATFDNVRFRSQPEFLTALAGTVTGLATYDRTTRRVDLTAVRLNAEQLRGTVEGAIDLGGAQPQLDLHLTADQWPLAEVVNLLVQQRLQDVGTLDVSLEEADALQIDIQGTAAEPVITGKADVDRGHVSFQPVDATYPGADLEVSRLEAAWDSTSKNLAGALTIDSGTMTYPKYGLKAEQLACTAVFDHSSVRVEPFSAVLRGNAMSGRLVFDYVSQEGELALNGTVSKIEDTPLGDSIKDTVASGSVHVDVTANRRGDRYNLDGRIDATQSAIAYNWWFDKPAGVGAAARVQATIRPRKEIVIDVDGEVASTKLQSTLKFAYAPSRKRTWRITEMEATAPSLDVMTVGKCIRLPYRITGGSGTDGHYRWERTADDDDRWRIQAGLTFDSLELLPNGSQSPFRFANAIIEVDMNRSEHSTGTLALAVDDATVPSFGEVWFLPLRTDPDLIEKYPPVPRDWIYNLQAKALAVPPWKGTEFSGTAYTTETTGGLNQFSATVDQGHIEGSYHNDRTSNAYDSAIEFRGVPIKYFLDHLKYPLLISGLATGNVAYGLDRDDPNTLQGHGMFDIREGELDTHYFFSQLEGSIQQSGAGAFPQALPFDLVHADLEFHKDIVNTPKLQLLSKGLSMEAGGGFIHGGDMNYDLKVAISPETAQKIPILRESFNIEGHRISQQDIQLAFKVTGPTFNPKGQISGLPPASVTLVSGALGITSEAVKLIDTPRRILVDLLKMGGGILGAQNR